MQNIPSAVRRGCFAVGLAGLLSLPACGGGGGSTPPSTVPTPRPVPAASIAASGAGLLVVHPSLDSRFSFALEAPIRIVESGGGTADWNFARMQMFRKGAEIERFEIGADTINQAGFKRIAASSNQVYTIAFRTNQDDFDDIILTLGFSDLKDARQFTAQAPLSSFSAVDISIIPLRIPTIPIQVGS